MYKFYCDETLFYKSDIDDSNYYIVNPKLTLEKGVIATLSVTLPHTNIIYDYVQKLQSIITIYDNDEEIFRGRVLYDEKDFYNNKNIVCEGELAFLLDSVKRPYEYQGSINDFFNDLIENHNSQVESKKQFKVGNITVTDNNDYINRSSIDYNNTFNVIKEKLIETHGGYLKSRGVDGTRYIDYVAEYGEINDQVIEFGVNLLDIKEYISAENVFTCLIPLGAKDETTGKRLTIESVNAGSDYLENPTGIEFFGKIFKFQIWDDVTIAGNLKTKGQAYLDSNIEMSVTLTLKAIDLHTMDINTSRIKVGDKVRVISLPHNLDKYFECTKITIDFQNPNNNEYTFGSTYKTLTDPSSGIDNKVITLVEEAMTKVSEETEQKIIDIRDSFTQEEIMDIITNNGEVEGVYLVDGQIWIDGTYIRSDSIDANKINVDKLSAISANLGSITGGSLNINNKFIVDENGNATVDGKVTARSGEVGGFTLNEHKMTATTTKVYDFTMDDWDIIGTFIYGGVTPTQAQIERYDLNGDGVVDDNDRSAILDIIDTNNKLTTNFTLYPKFTTGANSLPIFELEVEDKSRVWVDKIGQLHSNRAYFDYLYSDGTLLELKFSPMGCTKDGGGATLLWSGSDYAPMFYVGEIEQYKYFLVQLGSASSNHATWVLCPYCPTYISSYFRGIGGYETDGTDTGGRIYFVDGSISEGTVTIRSCWMRNSPTFTTVASATRMYVKKVVGIR